MADEQLELADAKKPKQCGAELQTGPFGRVRCDLEARHASVWHRSKPMPSAEARWLNQGSYELAYPTRAVA